MSTPRTVLAATRIARELSALQNGSNHSLAVAFHDEDVRHVRALIVGPPGTPYENGFYEFYVSFGDDYPIHSPEVRCMTTDHGHCRFSPNIYADGKVCLTILGTWHGESGEQWSGAQGLESVLLSIQSLMNDNPFQNEPGFEDVGRETKDATDYIAKIRHENLRVTVISRLEEILNLPTHTESSRSRKRARRSSIVGEEADCTLTLQPGMTEEELKSDMAERKNVQSTRWRPFSHLIKQQFLWHYDSYYRSIETHKSAQKDGTSFISTAFESSANGMEGRFKYTNLLGRLKRIRDWLLSEREGWVVRGKELVESDALLAHQLQFQFQQIKDKYSHQKSDMSMVELSLTDDDNPFRWTLMILGQSSTRLADGVLRVTLTIPPDFPKQQPHAAMDKPVFHHRVSESTGTICYLVTKSDDIESHIKAIIKTLEDGETTFDPRLVINPEAFALRWGDEESRCRYYRKLRRSIQDTLEG